MFLVVYISVPDTAQIGHFGSPFVKLQTRADVTVKLLV